MVSIDGVGAYDHVHRASMCDTARAPLLPFARLFYAEHSTYLWYDAAGVAHDIAQHPALVAAAATLLPGETVFAYLDDVYAVCQPERVHAVANVARVALQEHAGIEVHLGKTCVWNAAGEEPAGVHALQGPGGADLWVGAWTLPPERRGLVVLGTPVGHAAFVQAHLRQKRAEQQQLLDFHQRWSGIIAVAAQRALAATLAGLPGAGLDDRAALARGAGGRTFRRG